MMKCKSLILAVIVIVSTACNCNNKPVPKEDRYNNVAILYSCGRNSLSYALNSDITDMCDVGHGGWLPTRDEGNVMIVVAHQPGKTSSGLPSYDIKSPIHVIRLYTGGNGRAVRDTVQTFSEEKLMTDPAVMAEILRYVKDSYKAEHYGMVLSSHGSGWLPEGYLSKYSTNSFGEERQGSLKVEMDVKDMALHFPYHMDYMLFDVCLMGNIETVYELRKCADYIGVSPTEVLMDGFNYTTLAANLLKDGKADVRKVCSDYFEQYESSGQSMGATITLVKTDALDNLATVCRDLFARHREEILALDESSTQHIYRRKPWFFDMEDILQNAIPQTEELEPFRLALKECISYHAHTDYVLAYKLWHCCGLAMFLPQTDVQLAEYYGTLAWNRDTGLIQ